MNDQETGTVAELQARIAYIKSGYAVLTSERDDQKYDFVAEKDGNFRRVHVKNGRYDAEQGSIDVHVCVYTHKGAYVYTDEDIEEFAIYCKSTDEVYIIDVNEAPDQNMRLRVDDVRAERESLRWADDHLWSKKL